MLVYQVPIPEPLRFLEPRETETRRMHALGEYGLMHVKLYEDIARFGHIATSYAYPVKVNARYVMDPSPTPKSTIRMDNCPALQLFGAGRAKRIYAIRRIPMWYRSTSRITRSRATGSTRCALCGAAIPISTKSLPTTRAARCSSVRTPITRSRQLAGHRGSESAAPHRRGRMAEPQIPCGTTSRCWSQITLARTTAG